MATDETRGAEGDTTGGETILTVSETAAATAATTTTTTTINAEKA